MPVGINVKYQTTLRVINSEKKSSHIKCGFCYGGSCVCHERCSFGQPRCSDKPSLNTAALVNCVVHIYFIYRIRYLHHEIITEEYNWQGALTCTFVHRVKQYVSNYLSSKDGGCISNYTTCTVLRVGGPPRG